MTSFASKSLSVQQATEDLLSYCSRHDWAGYDPYDALNSRFFSLFPFLRVKAIQWPFTQCMKRCPINLRPLFLVPHTRNPKGIALFVSALIKLHKSGVVEDQRLITDLANDLIALKSPDQSYMCWGYSFAWQTRSIVVPKGTPNIICTSFAANALLDAYEAYQDDTYLDAASSAADFLLEVLYEDGDQPCFNYTPLEVAQVHNANLLGAALLTRVCHHTGSDKWLEPALTASRFSAEKQHPDGSWSYGEGGSGILSQQWIDNFHTGYNLCALQTTGRYAPTAEFDDHVTKGLAFYKDHFFLPDGTPKYYHKPYPIPLTYIPWPKASLHL